MPYPSKTDRQTILSAAVKELAHKGIRDLSLRNLAASLASCPMHSTVTFPIARHWKLRWQTKLPGDWNRP